MTQTSLPHSFLSHQPLFPFFLSYGKGKLLEKCFYYFYTPRPWRDGCNSFDIICVCVSVCVRLTLSTERTYIQTWMWPGGQVEEYLGQGQRQRSRSIKCSLGHSLDFWERVETREYDTTILHLVLFVISYLWFSFRNNVNVCSTT